MGDKKRILYMIPCLADGGIEHMIMSWISGLDKDRYQVDVLAFKTESEESKKKLEALGCKVYDKDIRNRQVLAKKRYLMKVMREGNYDIVHAHTNFAADYVNLKYAGKLGIKTRICHGHSANPEHGRCGNILHKMAKSLMRKYATIYTGCSEAAARELVGKKGIKSDVYKPIRNAIDCRKFRFDSEVRDKLRMEYDLDGKYVIGHVGRFEEEKNHEFILDVFTECMKLRDDVKLMLVGDGSLRPLIEDEADKLGIKDWIIFTGAVDGASDYYNAMDSFLFPSLYEGFGLSLLEAECSGLNCIGSAEINPDAFVLDTAKRMSLKRDAAKWAKALCSMQTDVKDRESGADEIKALGYDIEDNGIDILYE